MKKLVDSWYSNSSLAVLKPAGFIYALLAGIRRRRYLNGHKNIYHASHPLIVVGNITVGGTGKTPLVVYLAAALIKAGYKPGIVSRGFASKAPEYPFHVRPDSSVEHAGDEALLLAMNTGCPVVIDARRVEAVKSLEQNYDCDVIISDDGMQHYSMARNIEIAMIDGKRGLGNGKLLPQGPLREKAERLNEVDFIVCNGSSKLSFTRPVYQMTLKPRFLCHIKSGEKYAVENIARELKEGTIRHKVHAVAGIGNPERFFSSLCDCGFDIISHVYKDHHQYTPDDISFDDELEVVMTEKDAVKCRPFARNTDWFLKAEAELDERFMQDLLARLHEIGI